MTSIAGRRRKRPRHAKRRLDLSAVKDALKEQRLFPCLGLVTDEGVDSHFDLDGEDLLIECKLIPNEEPVTARMGIGGAGPGLGIWFIPPVGAEVALLICEGELEAGVFIVGILSTGFLPGGIAEGVTVIANSSKVLINDGVVAGTEGVIKRTPYDLHVHPTGVGPSGVPSNAGAAHTLIAELK